MNGSGAYCWKDTNNVYVGHWFKSYRHGIGAYLILAEDDGQFAHNKKCNGAQYSCICGTWEKDSLLPFAKLWS